VKSGANGGGLRRKPQTWARDGQIGHRNRDFFSPASVTHTLPRRIGHRQANSANRLRAA
jgi:hypothetical protein